MCCFCNVLLCECVCFLMCCCLYVFVFWQYVYFIYCVLCCSICFYLFFLRFFSCGNLFIYIVVFMYSYCYVSPNLYILFPSCLLAHFDHPECDFSVLFLSCKANARV